ncbi:hypothetical protein LMG28138_05679 [Pararobbsia alpina]|uniref:HTH luxR-type domain-containing protein n=1 Tax=Pararobbsia alpina TaxID=621374 RepID=A0A6S7D3M9_9BURK|nr:hypothetical protein LMG28138_05679 [Pararobbsia alpina]
MARLNAASGPMMPRLVNMPGICRVKTTGPPRNLSEITVKVHRGQVMRKMKARSMPDLVRQAESLGVKPVRPTADIRTLSGKSAAENMRFSRFGEALLVFRESVVTRYRSGAT